MIDSYHFGHIVINGKEYNSDVIVFPNRVKDHWWRKSGHGLAIKDIEEIIESRPEVLIIGCGADEMLKIPQETRDYIQQQGIELVACDTKKACEIYNGLCKKRQVTIGLHLTC